MKNGQLWFNINTNRVERVVGQLNKVRVFTHKLEVALRKEWSSRAIHKADSIEVNRLPPEFIRELAATLDRNMTWYLTLQEGGLSVADGDGEHSVDGAIESCSLAEFLKD